MEREERSTLGCWLAGCVLAVRREGRAVREVRTRLSLGFGGHGCDIRGGCGGGGGLWRGFERGKRELKASLDLGHVNGPI